MSPGIPALIERITGDTPSLPRRYRLVPKVKFELTRPRGQRSLSPPRLPVPPLRPAQA